MGRIEKLEEEMNELKEKVDKVEAVPEKKKKFNFPWKAKSLMKQADKKHDYVFIQYLTQKGDIEFRVEKVVAGNIVVIRNKVHVISPKRSFRYGRSTWYVIKEIDRYPVSNLDHGEIRRVGRQTDEDVPLLKAVFGAIQKKENPIASKNVMWIIGIIAVVGIGAFFLLK